MGPHTLARYILRNYLHNISSTFLSKISIVCFETFFSQRGWFGSVDRDVPASRGRNNRQPYLGLTLVNLYHLIFIIKIFKLKSSTPLCDIVAKLVLQELKQSHVIFLWVESRPSPSLTKVYSNESPSQSHTTTMLSEIIFKI